MLAGCASDNTSSESAKELRGINVNNVLENAALEAEARGDKAESLKILGQLYARDTENPITAIRYAKALRDDEQFNLAEKILQPFTQGDDAHLEALTELAMISLAQGDYKKAEKLARQTIEKDERNGRAFLALGTSLDAQGYHQQAEVAFRRGLDYWRGDPSPILNNLALNLASQGYLEEAVSVLEKAKKISPRRMEIERNLRIIRTLLESSPTHNMVKAPAPRVKPTPPQLEEKKPAAEGKPKKENKPAKMVKEEAPAPKDITPKVEPAVAPVTIEKLTPMPNQEKLTPIAPPAGSQ